MTGSTVRLAGGGSTWVYRFDRPQPADNGGFGAAHAVEIPIVSDTAHLERCHALVGASPSREVVDTAHGTWSVS